MPKVAVISDVHTEHWEGLYPYDLPTADYLVLAGDIGVMKKPRSYVWFIEQVYRRYKSVVCVLGNHEHYKGSFEQTDMRWHEHVGSQFPNVQLLHDSAYIAQDITFVGGTLWTDMDGRNPLACVRAEQGMSDYRAIRVNSYKRRLHAADTIHAHEQTKKAVAECLTQSRQTVVVTHHAPSYQSIGQEYTDHPLNAAYCSDMQGFILNYQPQLWVHGHCHSHCDYIIDKTRVVCNALGYPGERTGFKPDFVIEV